MDIIKAVLTANEKDDEQNEIFFVSTYNPLANDSNKRVQNAVADYNVTQPTDKQLKVRSSYRRSPSLKDLLMFHDSKASETHGVFPCKAGCILCKNYLKTGKSLRLKNGKILKANARFDCLSKNLLYIAVCIVCK